MIAMINDYIHIYSTLPASISPPLLSSEPKPRLPQWGAPPSNCYSYVPCVDVRDSWSLSQLGYLYPGAPTISTFLFTN